MSLLHASRYTTVNGPTHSSRRNAEADLVHARRASTRDKMQRVLRDLTAAARCSADDRRSCATREEMRCDRKRPRSTSRCALPCRRETPVKKNRSADRRKQEDGSSAGGGAHPADDQLSTLDAGILEEVCRLGHLPRRPYDPRSEEDEAEERLADRTRKSIGKLLPATLTFLKELASANRRIRTKISSVAGGDLPADNELPPLDFDILMDVWRLGHLPRLVYDLHSEEDKAERRLADRIRKKTKASFCPQR